MSDAHEFARTDLYHHRSSRRVCLTMGMAMALVASMAAVGQAAPIGPSFIVPFQQDTGGTLPSDLATGDVNGDGRVDAVVANLGPAAFNGGVAVHLGDGAGHLRAAVPTALPDGWGASNLAVADYNRDGKTDVTVQAGNTSGPGPLVMLLATSGGHFSVGQQIASGGGLPVAADFNGDLKPDLAFASTPSGGQVATVEIRFGDGQGNLGPAVAYPSQFYGPFWDVAASDLNGDGFPDLVLATGGSPTVLLNQGDGTFGGYISSFSPLLQGIALALADFNGDGTLDVALGDASGGHVEIGLGTGDGHFTPVAQYGGIAPQVLSLAAADFTGDGRPDVAANTGFASVQLLNGKGTGTFVVGSIWLTGDQAITTADLNADGRPDLLAFSKDPGEVYASLNLGRGRFRAPLVFPAGVSSVLASGDVNGDGRVDALAIGQLAGTFTPGIWVAAHLNRGRGAFQPPIVSTGIEGQATGFGVSSVAIADVNHDGKLDIVGGVDFIFPQAANLFVMLGNGDGSFGPATMYGTGDYHAATQSMALGDVNGDGELDIVGHTWTSIATLLGNGDGTFGPPLTSATGGVDQPVTEIADITGDGLPDVVSAVVTGTPDFAESRVMVHRGLGNGLFLTVQTTIIESNVLTGDSADLNGDARPDVEVAGAGGFDGGVSGTFVFLTALHQLAAPVYYPEVGGPLGDVNNDGAPDLLAQTSKCAVAMLNAGDGTFDTVVCLGIEGRDDSSGAGLSSAGAVADFTGDARNDLLARTQYGNRLPALFLYATSR